ncbi:hypothetical protein CBL_12940 [Carabus blaptoides fortunei]
MNWWQVYATGLPGPNDADVTLEVAVVVSVLGSHLGVAMVTALARGAVRPERDTNSKPSVSDFPPASGTMYIDIHTPPPPPPPTHPRYSHGTARTLDGRSIFIKQEKPHLYQCIVTGEVRLKNRLRRVHDTEVICNVDSVALLIALETPFWVTSHSAEGENYIEVMMYAQ